VVARKGQVIGISESVELRTVCATPIGKTVTEEDSWEHIVEGSAAHLSPEQKLRLTQVLSPRSAMWSGDLGKITAVRHHIPTSGPPIASQPYRAGPQS
jgi:hypothetical protein